MKTMQQKKLGNKGFSLVELIVVIAIMAVLIGVLAPTLIGKIEDSRLSKDKQNLDTVKQAIITAMADENVYKKVSANFTIQITGSSGAIQGKTGAAPDADVITAITNIAGSSCKLSSKNLKNATVEISYNYTTQQVTYDATTQNLME